MGFADAFGESGRPATGDEVAVPPNASLQIDLELISWKTVSDITKDRKVLKKTLKEGERYERPNDGAVVQGTAETLCFDDNILVWILYFD